MIDKLIYDKLIYIFSLILNKIDGKEEKCLENIIKVSKKLKNKNEEKVYSDLFYLSNDNQKIKKLILNELKSNKKKRKF